MEDPQIVPKSGRRTVRPGGSWCVMLVTESLFVVGDYRPLAVELLKTVVPGGARKFYRTVGPDFFKQFPINSAQQTWLQEARMFNGAWELLREYKAGLLNALGMEYPEVWIVEGGQARPFQLPPDAQSSSSEEYGLNSAIVMPLSWGRSHSLYCHRHRTWETRPCPEIGQIVITGRLTRDGKKKKWPDRELHAPRNTLVQASRQQTSFYLARPDEPVKLGRDEEGEAMAQKIIDAQRLALLLRVARIMTQPVIAG